MTSRLANELSNTMRQQAELYSGSIAQPGTGEVSSYDPNKYSVKVTMQPSGIESGWIPLSALAVGAGFGVVSGPNIGDMVKVEYTGGSTRAPKIGGRFFSAKNPALPVPSGEHWLVHSSGAFVKLTNDGKVTVSDKAGSTIVFNGDGTGTMTFANGLAINANTTINGSLLVVKQFTGQGGMALSGLNSLGATNTITGNTNFVGSVFANGHAIDDTHLHSGVTTGLGNSGKPL